MGLCSVFVLALPRLWNEWRRVVMGDNEDCSFTDLGGNLKKSGTEEY